MKTYLFLLLMLPMSAVGQELEMDSATMKLMYRRVVKVDSTNAGELYERSKQWLARTYKSANDVIQYDNKDEGKLIVRGMWAVSPSLNNERRWHVLTIECKDGRARYTFSDFVRETYNTTLGKESRALENIKFMKKSVREDFSKDAARTGDELEKFLTITTEQKKKDDGW